LIASTSALGSIRPLRLELVGQAPCACSSACRSRRSRMALPYLWLLRGVGDDPVEVYQARPTPTAPIT
jgi:hypothetical protein